MKLSEEKLQALEQMGASFLTVDECSIALEVDEVDFEEVMSDRTSKEFKAYWKGVLNAKVKHVKNVSDLANRGSSPAQQMIDRMLEKLQSRK